MQALSRLVPPKRFALLLWSVCLAVLVMTLLSWYFSAQPYRTRLTSDDTQKTASISAVQLSEAATDVTRIAKKLAETSITPASRDIFPLVPDQKATSQPFQMADTLVIQSGNRLVVFLNGRPVTKGSRLPGGEVVTRLTSRAITLTDTNGADRTIDLTNSFSAPPAIQKDDKK